MAKTNKKQETKRELSAEKKALINRLSRITGQINGVKKMIEEDRPCADILIQMMAISSSVKSTQRSLFESNFEANLIKKIEDGDKDATRELFELLKRI